ncbi:MAG: hypothetical protein ACI85O_000622 [Saprospiraceae bacterium]|jgi:hypothetical protein
MSRTYQFFEKNTSFIPVKVGMKAFYDRGKISIDNPEDSKTWRSGYGFGFYIVPLSEAFTISISAGFSDEEEVYPLIGIGAPFR